MLIDSKVYVYHMNVMKYKQTSTVQLMLLIWCCLTTNFFQINCESVFSKKIVFKLKLDSDV